MDAVLADIETAPIEEKMRALLQIADKVRIDGRLVESADIDRARQAGADDKALHDTVLVAAMFSMFNRYVDGLATVAPSDPAVYAEIGQRIAAKGYGSRFREGG
jgi:alkylhydroperoxidase family enzyme